MRHGHGGSVAALLGHHFDWWCRRWWCRRRRRWWWRCNRRRSRHRRVVRDKRDARSHHLAQELAIFVDAHNFASTQRALKEANHERIADFGVLAVNFTALGYRQATAHAQRSAFQSPFNGQVLF